MEAPETIELNDRALIYNKDTEEWEDGYQTLFRRMKPVTFFTDVTVSPPAGSAVSEEHNFRAYDRAQIYLKMGTIVSGADVWVAVQTSMDGSSWYQEYAENYSFWGYNISTEQSGLNISLRTYTKGNWIRLHAYMKGGVAPVSFSAKGMLM